MKKILIVGNKGSFLEDTINRFAKNPNVDVDSVLSNKCYESRLDNYSVIIYIGGETRFKEQMLENNIVVPKYLADYCFENDVSFVYLSSLSVFGSIYKDKIDFYSGRAPLDDYGRTKLEFDDYVKTLPNLSYKAIYPASINSARGRSSVEKVAILMEKYFFLKLLRLPGCLSFVNRSDLIELIYNSAVEGFDGANRVLASEHKELKDFSYKFAIPIPKFPLILFRLIEHLIGPKKSLYLRMVLRGVYYK